MTFLHVLYVQYFTDLFTVWNMFHKLSLILCISFSYEPSRQYGINPFLNDLKIIEISLNMYRENPDLLIELPIELPIDSAWNH